MSFSLTKPRSLTIDCDQRKQHKVGVHVRRVEGRLQYRPRARLDRLAGQESERALVIGKGREGEDCALGRSGFEGRERADLGRQWRISAKDARLRKQGVEHGGEPVLKPAALLGAQRGDELLPPFARQAPKGNLVCQYWSM
jgi:hypothetical protein